jgi:hypothetical protein
LPEFEHLNPHLLKPPTTQFTRQEEVQNDLSNHTKNTFSLAYRMRAVTMSFLD